MKDYLRVIAYIKPYRLKVILSFISNLLYSIFSIFTLGMIVPFISILFGVIKPVYSKPNLVFSVDGIIDFLSYYITFISTEKGVFTAMLFVSALFLTCSLLSNFFRFLGMYFLNPVLTNSVRDMQNNLYHKILTLPLSYYTQHKSGDIITRANADMSEMDIMFKNIILLLLREPWMILMFIITLLMISPLLTLVSILVFPLLSYFLTKISNSIRKKSKQGQESLSDIGSMLEESISGLRIIKGFNAIDYFTQKFKSLNTHYTRLVNKVYRRIELASPLSEVLSTISLCFVIGVGGYLMFHTDSGLNASTLILFILIFARLIPPLHAGVRSFNVIQKSMISAKRIFEVLDADEVIEEKENALSIKEIKEKIELRQVGFAYETDRYIFKNIDLCIEKGKTIAIVGNSGVGKTTLLNLFPRFYDVTEGEILIDNINIKEYIISDVRALMGLVSQDILLFNDTVYNNICFGLENIDEQAVIEAAKIANAHIFISEMPEGYQTIVGDRGVKLSGGQRQRISIARAILRNPDLLLLDEATSSLDSQSETYVQEALENIMKNRTTIIIAHRLATVQHADTILVLQNGSIVEKGTHQELLAKKGLYDKWVEMQQINEKT
ncbi:MAG: ABC transporter ATP-binding protein [Bacteroidales bacterium]|nr:ABC transporter ATP-binding protein [Bacteroidales bacterium]